MNCHSVPRAEYEFTQKGKDLGGMFSEAGIWARKYGYDFKPHKAKS